MSEKMFDAPSFAAVQEAWATIGLWLGLLEFDDARLEEVLKPAFFFRKGRYTVLRLPVFSKTLVLGLCMLKVLRR